MSAQSNRDPPEAFGDAAPAAGSHDDVVDEAGIVPEDQAIDPKRSPRKWGLTLDPRPT